MQLYTNGPPLKHYVRDSFPNDYKFQTVKQLKIKNRVDFKASNPASVFWHCLCYNVVVGNWNNRPVFRLPVRLEKKESGRHGKTHCHIGWHKRKR